MCPMQGHEALIQGHISERVGLESRTPVYVRVCVCAQVKRVYGQAGVSPPHGRVHPSGHAVQAEQGPDAKRR